MCQGVDRKTYHDKDRQNIKEIYHVKDTVANILQGSYTSFFVNGDTESKGQFENNETTGVWEFYYETGTLKMRGILEQSANRGKWEYFYENGQKSMQGNINGTKREGVWLTYYENGQLKEEGTYINNKRTGYWKTFFEDGKIKGNITYADDFGRYTEFYHDGKVQSEGPKMGAVPVGHWRIFNEDALLYSEGDFENGKKTGEWKYYHTNGIVAVAGSYHNNEKVGVWTYYFKDGSVSSVGNFKGDLKEGNWKAMHDNGTLKSEVTFVNGAGEYKEYSSAGSLLIKGAIKDDKREGPWQFFAADGKLEGDCEYVNGKGVYRGYYPNGSLQTKGEMEDDKKVGTWEIYEPDGKLSGYYRPFYDNKQLNEEIARLAGKSQRTLLESRGRHFNYFDQRFNEFNGLIVGTNPLFVVGGQIPLAVEYYMERRLGHEFEFIGIRNPFFKADYTISPGKKFSRGYSVCVKQKFYNPVRAGMWYFGHEIRFTNIGHFTNIMLPQVPGAVFTISSIEQRIEYGPVLGYRIMKRNAGSGFTIDTFVSYDFGYRGFDVDKNYESYFKDINQSSFSTSFHFGINFGNIFAYR